MNLVLIMIKEMIKKKINKKCDLNMFMFLKKNKVYIKEIGKKLKIY